MSVLITLTWWLDLGQRLLRQGQQVAVPVLLVVLTDATTRQAVDVLAVTTGLAWALGITLVKLALLTLARVTVTAGAPLWQRMLDRVVPAVAGAVVVFVPPVGPDPLAGLGWQSVAVAAVAAGLLALAGVRLDPPADPARAPYWSPSARVRERVDL